MQPAEGGRLAFGIKNCSFRADILDRYHKRKGLSRMDLVLDEYRCLSREELEELLKRKFQPDRPPTPAERLLKGARKEKRTFRFLFGFWTRIASLLSSVRF
jgi:hypothetical protein